MVVGGGFIGLEIAASARLRDLDTTVVEASDRLLARVVPMRIAGLLARRHEAEGVTLRMGAMVERFVSNGRGAVKAVELSTGHEVWLNSGPLEPAMLATMALPGLFLPQEIDGRVLTDGGLVAPLPVAAAAGLGRPVIAVDLLSGGVTAANPPQLFEARGPLRYAAVIGKRLGLLAMLEAVHQASLVLNVKLLEAQLAACPAEVVIVPEVAAVEMFTALTTASATSPPWTMRRADPGHREVTSNHAAHATMTALAIGAIHTQRRR